MAATKKTDTAAPKLRIKLRSYDLKMLESAVTKIL
jgi:ribosomal protein S10